MTTSALFRLLTLTACSLLLALTGCKDVPPPSFVSVDPTSASEGELVVLRGNDLGEIRELLFNGEPINFNTAYNSDVALLFRIPKDTPLGDYIITVRTEGGSFDFPFLVSEPPPRINRFLPRDGDPGDTILIIGDNYIGPPLEVWFRNSTVLEQLPNNRVLKDSIQGEIIYVSQDPPEDEEDEDPNAEPVPDSMLVIVPPGASSGPLTVVANGGFSTTLVDFFTFSRILVADFDGNGERGDFSEWIARGTFDQVVNNRPFITNSRPDPIDGNFLQLSGVSFDPGNVDFVGFIQTSPSRDSFELDVPATRAFLEMDVNTNGRPNTYIQLAFREQEGLPGDFTSMTPLALDDEPGWQRLRIPLQRYRNPFQDNALVTPGKINIIKINLLDADKTGRSIQVSIDNIRLVRQG